MSWAALARVSADSSVKDSIQSVTFGMVWNEDRTGIMCSIDEPNEVVSSRNQIECSANCMTSCAVFNFMKDRKRCEIFRYRPYNYAARLGGCLSMKVCDRFHQPILTNFG